MLTEQEKAEGWIEWKGGECPLPPFTIVDIRNAGGFYVPGGNAAGFNWKWGVNGGDIVAYRVKENRFYREKDSTPKEPTKSLWDEYAMAALTGISHDLLGLNSDEPTQTVKIVERTIYIADKLMEERRKRDVSNRKE